MIEFVKINLLPYREEIKQRKKQQFKVLMLSALLVGAGISALTYLTINNAISRQEDRNALLEREIKRLDESLGEILKLQQEKENFLSKKQKVEELQDKRSQAAYIIDSLNVVTPDNSYLTALEAESSTSYKMTGRASSDNKIAMLMRSLPSTGVFAQPELLSIKKIDNYQEFTLKVLLNNSSRPSVPAQNPVIDATEAGEQKQEVK